MALYIKKGKTHTKFTKKELEVLSQADHNKDVKRHLVNVVARYGTTVGELNYRKALKKRMDEG